MTGLGEHLAAGGSTVCRAWVVERRDGQVFGFTDHDTPIRIDGVECRASSGLAAGALQAGTGLAVDNAEAHGALSHDVIREEDLRAGRWDAAEVTAWLVNWEDTEMREILFQGSLGEISWGGGMFSAELRGLAEALNRVRGRVFQGRCDAVLGDGRCRKALGPSFVLETTVETVERDATYRFATHREFAPKWFERGRLEVLDGPAMGMSERVKMDRGAEDGRRITLWQALRCEVAAGTRVRLEAGCDKRAETCRLKFDNMLNFRGFPHIPGDDWLMSYPTRDGRNDGGRS
ncbi:DUF2163 domain-containing protein [Jannaschia sp. S6380]|uniref:DUF2163 domain-containing protein n=1 Tax=Jannaschia sp. S6380 TaxID=2926408 RepID=UPI001FF6992A|nr:DUF2163 domain-containing protein [Jannaschia sp. S6380]